MRPRLGGRGRESYYSRIDVDSVVASMRPRLGGRGRDQLLLDRANAFSRFNEAPARWPGKRSEAEEGVILILPASMRPRLGGRGRGGCPIRSIGNDVLASMRPRLGGRGRGPPGGNPPQEDSSCFNEAPARWPGKREAARKVGVAAARGFNEAPARWPGKSPVPPFLHKGSDQPASMRPRLGGRGRGLPRQPPGFLHALLLQ